LQVPGPIPDRIVDLLTTAVTFMVDVVHGTRTQAYQALLARGIIELEEPFTDREIFGLIIHQCAQMSRTSSDNELSAIFGPLH
jgi:hypothetical protein